MTIYKKINQPGNNDFVDATKPWCDVPPRVCDLGQSVFREVEIKPTMCGQNGRFVGQIGDWTWEAVSALCNVNTLKATDEAGRPTYLSFYYYEVLGDALFHLHSPTFGDRYQVVSRCFDYGSESILTLHRIAPIGMDLLPSLSVEEFFQKRIDGCLYVQNFNRWVQRGDGGNSALLSATPEAFIYKHLPMLDDRYSPRLAYDLARREGWFPASVDFTLKDTQEFPYVVNMGRDLNGVGLLYFASYFEIADTILAQWWLAGERSISSFLQRKVLSQRVLFQGNAEAGCSLSIVIRQWHKSGDSVVERFDLQIRESEGSRVLAVVEIFCETTNE